MEKNKTLLPIEDRRIDLTCFACRLQIGNVRSCWVEWRWKDTNAGESAYDFVVVHTFHASPIGGCRTDRVAGSALLAFVDPAPQARVNYKEQLRDAGMVLLHTKKDRQMFALFDGLERRFQADAGHIVRARAQPVSNGMRFEVLKRAGFRCQICGRNPQEDGVKLEVDHIIPVSKGGPTALFNLQTLCSACNSGKFTKDM